jgi:hypothetical protein
MEEVGAVKGSAGFGIALLLIAVAAGLLFDSGSVQRIAYDDGHAVLPAAVSLGQSRPVTASLTIRLVRGERFASFDDLVGDQQAAGYVKIDAFGDNWPATVTEMPWIATRSSSYVRTARSITSPSSMATR